MTGGGSVVMATHRSAAATRIESSRGHIAPCHSTHRGYARVWFTYAKQKERAVGGRERELGSPTRLALLLGYLALIREAALNPTSNNGTGKGKGLFSERWPEIGGRGRGRKVEEIGEPRSWFSFGMPRYRCAPRATRTFLFSAWHRVTAATIISPRYASARARALGIRNNFPLTQQLRETPALTALSSVIFTTIHERAPLVQARQCILV